MDAPPADVEAGADGEGEKSHTKSGKKNTSPHSSEMVAIPPPKVTSSEGSEKNELHK